MNLKPCKTCGQMIATNASFCPHCGQKFNRIGGCFAYFIIFIVVSMMIGYVINNFSNKTSQNYSNQSPFVSPNIPKEKPSKEFIEKSLKKMKTRYDDVKGITWYYDKSTPNSDNTNNIHLYIGKENSGNPWLRIRIRYSASDWLFISSYNVKADNEVYTITTSSLNGVERNNSSGDIWEWYDTDVDNKIISIVDAIISSKASKIRYNGRQYYNERIISQKEKVALKNVLDAYFALGG